MPKLHFKQNILNDAFRAIHDHLAQHYGKNTTPEHVKAITLEAFELLQQRDCSLKMLKGKHPVLNSHQRCQLIAIVKEIVVSPHTPWKPALVSTTAKVKQLFYNALRGSPPSLLKFRHETTLLKAVTWKTNPEILKEGRALIQELLENVSLELEGKEAKPSHQRDFHFEMIVGDLLSLYPFAGVSNGEKLTVPVIVDGKWRRVDYIAETIELSPKWMGSPLIALGLSSGLNSPAAPPLLIFKGTTYPTDHGFGLSLLTDLNPAASVGSYAFRLGRQKIGKWLSSHASANNKAVIYGKSLGGALSWRTGLHFSKYVRKVMAYGPPGFTTREARQLQRSMHLKSHPAIHVFCQKGDPIPFFDKLARRGVHYYLVLGSNNLSGFRAHAETYSVHPNSAVIRLNVSKEARCFKRHALTTLRFTLSLILFPLILLTYSAYFAIVQSTRIPVKVLKLSK